MLLTTISFTDLLQKNFFDLFLEPSFGNQLWIQDNDRIAISAVSTVHLLLNNKCLHEDKNKKMQKNSFRPDKMQP